MLKKIFSCAFIFYVAAQSVCFAQIPNFKLAVQTGSGGNDFSNNITRDSDGNTYTTGFYSGTVDFDPSPTQIYNLTATPPSIMSSCRLGTDIYVQKLDPAGNLIWAKSFGGDNCDGGIDIAVDEQGNVYTTGHFSSTGDFDPSPTQTFTLTCSFAGNNDVYIHKLDASGNFVWAKSFGSSTHEKVNSLVLDPTGFIYLGGTYLSTVDFDPSPTSTFSITPAGSGDAFLEKLDFDGNFIWAKSIGANKNDYINDMLIDEDRNLYFTGTFDGTVDFDPSASGTFLLTSNPNASVFEGNAFIEKLAPNGDFLWAKILPNSLGGYMTRDPAGNLYFTGIKEYGPDLIIQCNIQKTDNAGNLLWTRWILSDGTWNAITNAYNIVADTSGNTYTIGKYDNRVDFDPSPTASYTIGNNGWDNIFIEKLDKNGNFVWVHSFGSNYNDIPAGLILDSLNTIYFSGGIYGTFDADPGPNTYQVTCRGERDAFILALLQCTPKSYEIADTVCNGILFNNIWRTESGIYTETMHDQSGCDSTVTFDLTVFKTNVNVTQTNNILTAVSEDATFQWIDCETSEPIDGATEESFEPTVNGTYAVIATSNETLCTDTSDCYAVLVTAVQLEKGFTEINLYPNPATQQVTIALNKVITSGTIKLLNALGQTTNEYPAISGDRFTLDLSSIPAGLYQLEVIDQNSTLKKNLIKAE